MDWRDDIDDAPEGEVLETKIDDGAGERNVAKLKRVSNLWFLPDGSMYVYYTPTHWRPIQLAQAEGETGV